MNVFIISLLLICLMGCSAQNVKDVKKGPVSPSCSLCQHSV
ncbi:TPA: colicin release lysis protein [Salmonella enterica]|uniref:Colicin release lysis protein n=1 Tax=Salmonella enterica TaxID=28901 RepID=A0A759RPH6_SALER|nr:colicin release lysis protein [Salmonella enterica]EHU7139093.1 colicin release lysis protein [Salmonella enterica]EIE6435432.1 colicin release lysis protein [Salmonella enterica]EIG1430357.1 colicin release lysis protein [Salmonella enterica]EIG1435942.1 colicin release lysis protein [Salmonella enterica]